MSAAAAGRDRRNRWQTDAVSFAECVTCDWTSGDTPHSHVAARAMDHARRKDHRVITHRTVEYDFRSVADTRAAE